MARQPLFSLAVFAAVLTLGTGAQAATVYCSNCMDRVQGGMLITAIGTAQAGIVGAIQGASTAATTASMENARVVSETNAATESAMEKARIENRFELRAPCNVTASAAGASSGERVIPQGSGRGGGGGTGGGTPRRSGASAEMKKALDISEGTTKAPMPEAQASLGARGACGTFVLSSASGARGRNCTNAGFGTGNSNGHPDADVKAETIFDGPQTTNDVNSKKLRRRLTLDEGDNAQQTAVAAFIRNMETPVDLRELNDKELKSDAGRNYLALRDSYDALMSVATKPMRDQQAYLTASTQYLPQIKQMAAAEDGDFVKGYLNENYPSWSSKGVSLAELINLEAVRRHFNPKWHLRLVASNEKQLLTEIAQMQAAQLWMNARALERMQQQAIINGAMMGSTLRQERMPMLVRAHQAATR